MKNVTEKQLAKKADKKAESRGKPEAAKMEAKAATAKKWKGKEWFIVLSPKIFGEKKIAETPCTDPKTLINRNIEVSVADLIGQPTKYHMKFLFKVTKIQDKSAFTRFNGYNILREYMMRFVRKHNQKVTLIENFDTKDGWHLQMTITSIMNRNTDTNIKRKMRLMTIDFMSKNLSKSTIDDVLRNLIAGNLQKAIKKEGSKIYPVRFTEIEKIEVLRAAA